MKNVRETAYQAIYKVLEDGEFSHIVLAKLLKEQEQDEKRDRAFVTRLTEGTLERLLTLDYILNQRSKIPVNKMKPVIRTILRMSVYQLLYMDSVPDSAVCNEAVKLVKAKGLQGLSGFVNGVLRGIAREKEQWMSPDSFPDISIRYSLPKWLCTYLEDTYGREAAEKIAAGSMRNPETTIRVNTSKITAEELVKRLTEQGFTVKKGVYAKDAWQLSGYDSLTRIPEFTEGLFQVQDESSMLIAQLAGLKKDDFVVDVCAAPGGKSLHAANLLRSLGGGSVLSRDLTEKKTALIEENITRLGADNIRTQVWDALQPDDTLTEQADVVIADLPCSGIGIMAKKPEIRYRMTKEDQEALVALQKQILAVIHRYVKPGGILMYSTCTINKKENEENAKEICEKYGFVPELIKTELPEELRDCGEFLQLLPGIHACDGFFIARLRKI